MDSRKEFWTVIIKWIVPFIFFAGAIWIMLIALRFNMETYKLVREIQRLENINGRDWPFWSDRSKKYIYLMTPDLLIEKSDEGPVLHAKEALILHRKTFRKRFFLGVKVLILELFLIVVVLIIGGLYQHYS